MKTIDIKGKPYVEVHERVRFFRENFPEWSLVTDIISSNGEVVVFRASIIDDKGVVRSTGHAYEKDGSTFINKTSYIENCETSAVGRALGNLNIGIQTSIASADEVGNAIKQQQPTESVTQIIETLLFGYETEHGNELKELEGFGVDYTKFLHAIKAKAKKLPAEASEKAQKWVNENLELSKVVKEKV